MQKNKEVPGSEVLSELVAKGMREKKAVDIRILDLRAVENAVADFFVVCSANSDTQIDAISDSVEEQVYKGLELNPWHREGKHNREWVIIDYVDVVAHIFRQDRRVFYSLEELWADAPVTEVA